MPKLTPQQVGILIAYNRWGPSTTVADARKFMDTAIAVAIAESGLDYKIVSPTHDYGLFQINRAAHSNYFPNGSTVGVLDPFQNVRMAKEIWTSAGRSFTPWTTYTTDNPRLTYKRFLGPGARVYDHIKNMSTDKFKQELHAIPGVSPGIFDGNPLQELGEPDLGDAITGIAGEIPNAIGAFGDKIITGAKAVGFFLLALALLIIGIIFLLKDTKVGKGAISLVNPASKAKLL